MSTDEGTNGIARMSEKKEKEREARIRVLLSEDRAIFQNFTKHIARVRFRKRDLEVLDNRRTSRADQLKCVQTRCNFNAATKSGVELCTGRIYWCRCN